MPALLFLIIAVLLLPGSPAPALAEEFPDISLARGILLYEGFSHWLNGAYDFSDSKSGQSSNSHHALRESYNAYLQMALLDPHIFDANLQGGIVFDQNWNRGDVSASNSSGSNIAYQYNFSGIGLDRSRIPFTLLSFHSTTTTQNTYAASSTTDSNGNEFGIFFLNDKLKSRFQFSRNSNDTTTAGTSSSYRTNSYAYDAEHRSGTFSTTSFAATFSDQSGSTSDGKTLASSANSLLLSNSLNFGAQQKYSLLASFQLNNTITNSLPARTLSFSEAFVAALGRALFLNATYSLANNRTSSNSLNVPDSENTLHQGDIGITHKLFESLQTRLHGSASLNKINDGTENKYKVSGDATYNKNLAAGRRLSLGVNKGYDLVDRNVSSGNTTVRDELHPAVHQGDVITVALAGGTLRSPLVITSRNPLFTYVEGVDYSVNYPLGRITMLSSSLDIAGVGPGTDLYLSYTLYNDPQLKYSTDTLSLTSSLTLLDSNVTIGVDWSTSGQTVISGPAANSLQDSRALMVYVDGRYDTYFARVSYLNSQSGNLTYQAFEGNVSASWQTANATVSLSARDSYNIYGATLDSPAYWDNNADLSVSYSRKILANTKCDLQGNANDSRSERNQTRDSLSLRANCQTTLNMVSISLNGQSAWIFDQNGTSRNDSLHIDFTRYF